MNTPLIRLLPAVALMAFAVPGQAQVVRAPVSLSVIPMPGGHFPKVPVTALPGQSLPFSSLPGAILPSREFLPNRATIVPVLPVARMVPLLREAYGLEVVEEPAPVTVSAARESVPAASPVQASIEGVRRSFQLEAADEPAGEDAPPATGFDGEANPRVAERAPAQDRRSGRQTIPEYDLERGLGLR